MLPTHSRRGILCPCVFSRRLPVRAPWLKALADSRSGQGLNELQRRVLKQTSGCKGSGHEGDVLGLPVVSITASSL